MPQVCDMLNRAAQLGLGQHYVHRRDHDKSPEYLNEILRDPGCTEYSEAAKLMGHVCYDKRQYAEALEYYDKGRANAEYYEYTYELYFWKANCHHYLKRLGQAVSCHRQFLEENWEPDRLSKQVEFSRRYVALGGRSRSE